VESVHNTHQGAYDFIAHAVNWWADLPTPDNDVGIERIIRSHEVCGAEWERLLNWFPEDIIAELHAYELQLLALDVPNSRITKGEFQVIFVRDAAVVVAAFQNV
jgi:hypothetical protein